MKVILFDLLKKKIIFLWSLLLACRNARGHHGGEILVEGKLTSLVSGQQLLFLLRSCFLGKHNGFLIIS